MARWRHPIQNRPYNVLVLLLLCKLFFGGSYDPGGSENHGGTKSLGGGRGGTSGPKTNTALQGDENINAWMNRH